VGISDVGKAQEVDGLIGQPDKIPDMNNAQLGEVELAIALNFFGEDAYSNPPEARVRLIKPEIYQFVRTLLSCLWQQVRNSTKSQFKRLEKGKVEVTDEFERTLSCAVHR
jgi:hypothetical protein